MLFVDEANTAVWLKLPTKELRALAGKQLKLLSGGKEPARMQQLRMPYDRYGETHKRTHLQTCDALDEALSNYRGECWLCVDNLVVVLCYVMLSCVMLCC
jgi:hypothetical protein